MLVARQGDGSVKAFLNACSHRGMKVCRADLGNAKSFTCTYHGWTYDMGGALVGVPYEERYRNLDKRRWGLHPVARVESYKGMIFGSFDPEAPPLLDYLGDMAWYLDLILDRREGGIELVGGVQKWVIEANWKFGAENFVQDMHHVGPTHAAAIMAWLPEGMSPAVMASALKEGIQVDAGNGHGTGFFTEGDLTPLIMGPVCGKYLTVDSMAEAERRLGPVRPNKIKAAHATVFPSMSYLPQVQTLRVWHPKGPLRMEVWAWIFVDKAATPEVKEAFRLVDAAQFRAGRDVRARGRRELEPVLRRRSRLRLSKSAEQHADEPRRGAHRPRLPRPRHPRLQRDERAELLSALARAAHPRRRRSELRWRQR